ncbi:type IV secretion system protein [Neisseria sp. P0004.S004]|jgi:virB6 protein|uniref:type IV secretion system protein n=1 Tax=unclassified Neisseria TaxID=2623750 RepID=UPI00069D3953
MDQFISGVGELAIYTSIRDYIYARIEFLTEHLLSKNLSMALSLVLALLTLWIMVQGYLIATGRSQEGLKGFAFGLGKAYFIVFVALGVASSSNFAIRTLTDTTADTLSEIMRGDNKIGAACLTQSTDSFVGCKIDQNLTVAQSIMGMLSRIDTAGDPNIFTQLNQAKWFAGVGTAGPGVVAGTMLIVFRIAMALFIGFAPIFILCLLFKKTAPLFQKWLYYGLATIFSGVMLGVMSDIAMDLVSNVGTSLFLSKEAMQFVTTKETLVGLADTATQQLGLGLILSTLLIVVPPMAGMWFNGVMGSFSGYNPAERWNNPNNGQPSTMPGHNAPPQINSTQQQIGNNTDLNTSIPQGNWQSGNTVSNTNVVKTQGQSTLGIATGSKDPKNPIN